MSTNTYKNAYAHLSPILNMDVETQKSYGSHRNVQASKRY